MPVLNGGTAGILVWVVIALLGLAGSLVALLGQLHAKQDDERNRRIEDELKRIRDRLHRVENTSSRVDTLQRWMEEDARREERRKKPRG